MSDEIIEPTFASVTHDGVDYELEARPARHGGDVHTFAQTGGRTVLRGYVRGGEHFVEHLDGSLPYPVVAELAVMAGFPAPPPPPRAAVPAATEPPPPEEPPPATEPPPA